MTSRWYKKQQTRRNMIDAGLKEIAQGRSFDSLSLREVTRDAGIAPTTFYRHFRDMEAYGQAMIEAAEEVVTADAKKLRKQLLAEGETVRLAVTSLITDMQRHPAEYRLLLNLRLGPNPVLRAGATRVLGNLSNSLAEGLSELSLMRRRPVEQPRLAAESITSLLLGRAGDIMAVLHQSADAIVDDIFDAVRLILQGAEQPMAPLVQREIA